MSDIKLLPCPFCGSKAEIVRNFGRDGVSCSQCGANFRSELICSEAGPGSTIADWNTRIDRWIPVNLGPPYDNRPKKSGKILVLTKKKEIFQVHITVGEDEFEQGDGTPIMCPTHSCFLPTYGNVLLGEDDCITHYRYITLPGE